jgi:glycosyltransferase involved in cell wall biosynthesis
MRIGIGITTNNRPELLKECLQNIYKHTYMSNVMLYVADDTIEKKGVAVKKNECLRALQECDYVFLFDDDSFPINDGWVDFFIQSNQNHLLFLNKGLHQKKPTEINFYKENKIKYTIEHYHDCGGVFMFMTKDAIQKVGAFNEKFVKYGFEHAEYSIRILGKQNEYPMLKNTNKYIFSHDYSTFGHKSSITDFEKQTAIKNNWDKFFKEPIQNTYIPL